MYLGGLITFLFHSEQWSQCKQQLGPYCDFNRKINSVKSETTSFLNAADWRLATAIHSVVPKPSLKNAGMFFNINCRYVSSRVTRELVVVAISWVEALTTPVATGGQDIFSTSIIRPNLSECSAQTNELISFNLNILVQTKVRLQFLYLILSLTVCFCDSSPDVSKVLKMWLQVKFSFLPLGNCG